MSPRLLWHLCMNGWNAVRRVGGGYFFLLADCFANTACCFCCFDCSALACFCDACLWTAFGDLSPIIDLPFVCGLSDRRNDWFLRRWRDNN